MGPDWRDKLLGALAAAFEVAVYVAAALAFGIGTMWLFERLTG